MSAELIEWHEECYRNSKATLDQMYEMLVAEQMRFERAAYHVQLYREQIDKAKLMGKKKFDRDRFKGARRS